MTDDQTPAPEAGDEDVANEAEQVETEDANDAADEEGQEKDQPAEDEAAKAESEDEKESRSKARRERRKAEMERLRKEAEASEHELSEANKRLEQLEKAVQGMRPPKEDDYTDYAEYQAALSAYNSVKILDERQMTNAKAEIETRQERHKQAEQQRQAEARRTFEESCVEAREKYADFDQVARRPDLPVTPAMADMIVGMDGGTDVLYHLGKNPEMAARIAQLPPVQAALEIGRIEAGLATPRPIAQSKAPPPIAPVGGAAKARKDPAKMTPAEYRAWREGGGTF